MRGDPRKGNPNPLEISVRGIRQTSRQAKAHLLCRNCEQLFSKNGERWVFSNGLRSDGTFPLASVLASSAFALDSSGSTKIYRAAEIPQINISALTYFAASMFWRASVYPWKLDGSIPVPLGAFEEPFREYLIGAADFPSDVTLTVTVREESDTRNFTHEPVGERREHFFVAKFPMPGFGFSIAAGKELPELFHRVCFVRGEGNPLFMSRSLEKHIVGEGARILNKTHQNLSRHTPHAT